jgi:hypothetical protein
VSKRSADNSGGGCGCISLVAGVLFVWALLFGVTIDGRHYGLSGCSSADGLQIDRGSK